MRQSRARRSGQTIRPGIASSKPTISAPASSDRRPPHDHGVQLIERGGARLDPFRHGSELGVVLEASRGVEVMYQSPGLARAVGQDSVKRFPVERALDNGIRRADSHGGASATTGCGVVADVVTQRAACNFWLRLGAGWWGAAERPRLD
jgi:hypothetical protein